MVLLVDQNLIQKYQFDYQEDANVIKQTMNEYYEIDTTVSILQGGGIAPSSNCDLCFDIGGII